MHYEFNRTSEKLKAFRDNGNLAAVWECRNRTVNEGYGHYGMCPEGEYLLGEVTHYKPPLEPFGYHFIELLDVNDLWVPNSRSDIGIHGGGSGLLNPFAHSQGWQITEGCFRLQNIDLETLLNFPTYKQRFTVC